MGRPLGVLSTYLSKHCRPMLREILKGIEKRFGSYFNDRELKLAAILHPRFKLHWLPDEQKASHEEFLRDEFNAEQDYGSNSSAL